MKPEEKDKASLLKREMEIKRLIRQMEFDQLHSSTVYKNLGQELNSIKHELMSREAEGPKK
ncbi:MAG: hypothetical protein OEV74_11930 [Cyclobacteriaceae bacterium]|nr:hypothetical protein [Cyclobacteriaceae bacterium]MDH4296985.1 hypothetical protein [Cyclobacteriaceae bacterium]MDH5250250.1 hypothetical protein [Cyclobacteriaceae bacterium]